jgi:hypothetical protein
MTITPWCSIERPGLLASETRTRKFVTRVQEHVEFCSNRTAFMNMSKQPFDITPEELPASAGEHAAVLASGEAP